ncbi:MAG: hypothetical protein WCI97_10275 [Bacteroidota bacterium]
MNRILNTEKLNQKLLFGICCCFLLPLFFSSCKKEVLKQNVYDNVYYEVTPVTLYTNNAEKNKQKSSIQYISILYSDLFHQTIPGSDLNNLGEVILSMGDKGLANQMILERLLTLPGISIPSQTQMNADLNSFITSAYQRFYLRNPTEYEKYYLKNLIQNDASVTPEIVYAAFALSNEYMFY